MSYTFNTQIIYRYVTVVKLNSQPTAQLSNSFSVVCGFEAYLCEPTILSNLLRMINIHVSRGRINVNFGSMS